METRRLFYEDPRLGEFTAVVTGCRESGEQWAITLDATAFYPEGGGQAADTGALGPCRVLDTQEQAGAIVHFCDGPLTPGQSVTGRIDWEPRFRRMQQHTGEHIVSGLLHRRFGCHNVGFHMGAELITIDFDCPIPSSVLPEIEAQANELAWRCLPVRCYYPSQEELESLVYRTKRPLPWPVRIVEIPGVDRCACCGVHVVSTGEVGLIKLFSAVPFRGGTRMEMACGWQALLHLNEAYRQNKLVSQAFSVQLSQTGAAAQRMNALLAEQKYQRVGLQKRIFSLLAGNAAGQGNTLLFEEGADSTQLREMADALAHSCGGIAAVFSGSDESGYQFCICAPGQDLRQMCRLMTQTLSGRGGGKPDFQQGKVSASRQAITDFWNANV